MFNIKSGKKLTEIYLKSDVLLLACVFENFIKVSVNDFGLCQFYLVSLPSYTWECGLKYTGTNLQSLQEEDLIWTLENIIREGIGSVMGNCYVKPDETR